MDTSEQKLSSLFNHLGLASGEQDIQRFLTCHRVAPGTKIAEAGFWSENQARFLKEAAKDDADWAEVIEQLDAMLRH